MDELREQHWTIDKRISLGHLYTFTLALLMSLTWLLGLQFQINGHADEIAGLEKSLALVRADAQRDMARLENVDAVQYAEIIRRLELLQLQMNEFATK